MTADRLTAWLAHVKLSKARAAAELGIARSTLDRYLDGESPIPRTVALAMAAIDKRLEPWS